MLGLAYNPTSANAFCGFYVAKADTDLFNKASKVVIARNEGRTVITMANDFQGELDEFAMVIPVPSVLEQDQIRVAENALIDHLDAYTAPRLVEYFDENPCRRYDMMMSEKEVPQPSAVSSDAEARALGVTIEAEYSIGEYDIVILSAKQSVGLATWLDANGYRLPDGAEEVLSSYLAAGMKFFVAKVDLGEQTKLGFTYLRPLQIEFHSENFMLPIRLGMLNADGPQELFVFTLTRRGRVEPVNYRMARIPSDVPVPLFVGNDFGAFYNAMFDRSVEREAMRTVFLEYAWDMAWCDPCAADPLSADQLRVLGADWQDSEFDNSGQARDVFVTRLHVRYDDEHFPDDLMFRETEDRENFQGRYVMTHAWNGRPECREATDYVRGLRHRYEREAQQLASLTGWSITDIRARMASSGQYAALDRMHGRYAPDWRRRWLSD
jgi:hypothetical protein